MKIKINDAVTEIPDGLTIAGLLGHQKVKMPDMVSVQLNGIIVERTAFPSTQVREHDSVDFMYFMGGGGERWEVSHYGLGPGGTGHSMTKNHCDRTLEGRVPPRPGLMKRP